MEIEEIFEKYDGEVFIPIEENSTHFKDIINIAACYNADVFYNNGVLILKIYNIEYFEKLLNDLFLTIICLENMFFRD